MALKVWYTVSEASELLGKSDRTIRRQIAEKKLTSRRVKGVVSVYINPANLPQSVTPLRNPKQNNDIPQEKQSPESDMTSDKKVMENEREKDLKIAQLIKDLDETKSMVDWLKKGYENLQATHYETTRALGNLQLQLSPPRGEKTAEGEIIGEDKKASPWGIIGAKKGKFISDLTNILLVLLLLGLLVVVVSFLIRGF